MISINKIWKSYGEKVIFEDFSLDLPEGETTCIMGPSGCGKTTLLNLLLGLEKPDSGSITGLESIQRSAVFQEDRLCENVSASANLRLANSNLTKKDAESLLRDLGLGDSLRQPVREFSGGMKRRTAILRALAAQYDILLLDEPFKGLDQQQKEQVMAYCKEKTAGKTVVLVTHEKSEAEFFGGRLLLL